MVPFCWSLSPNRCLFNKRCMFNHLFEDPEVSFWSFCFFHFIWRNSASGVLMLLVAFLRISFCGLWNFSFQVISRFSIFLLQFLAPPGPVTEQLPTPGPCPVWSLLWQPRLLPWPDLPMTQVQPRGRKRLGYSRVQHCMLCRAQSQAKSVATYFNLFFFFGDDGKRPITVPEFLIWIDYSGPPAQVGNSILCHHLTGLELPAALDCIQTPKSYSISLVHLLHFYIQFWGYQWG